MTQSSASGERQALRGYRWQYDHIATLVYDALYDGDLVSVRLTDPEAGRVDDLVLCCLGGTDAYQFKSVERDGYVTFNQIVQGQKSRSGSPAPSLVRSLGDGWKSLQSRTPDVRVHLVMQQLASPNDHLGIKGDADCPPGDHFASFLKQVLEPIRSGNLEVDEVATGWRPALTKLCEASGVAPEEFAPFLRVLHLDLNAGRGVPAAPSTRRTDILALSDKLHRSVSESSDVVELDENGVLQLMGWTQRTRLHSRHEFPVDLDTYAPLTEAIDQLNDIVAQHDSGYVAVLGPPGAGKSTLLSQALTSGTDRVLRYYAYVPKIAAGRTRLTARSFLHDIVYMLQRSGIASREREITSSDSNELRQQLAEQLDSASAEFADTGRRTILVVDGLDHVERDYRGNDSLIEELPRPEELPLGVLLVLGSRTLAPVRAHARQQLAERQAIVDLQYHVLSQGSVLDICQRAPVTTNLAPEMHQRIAELSKGYPLALSYLLNRLRHMDGSSAEEILAGAPAYQGDIAAEYRAVWDELQDDTDIVTILTVCSRLRIGFTTDWLFTWARTAAVQKFQRKLLYLFRQHHDGWRFFHDSFRQFASDHTALGDNGLPDAKAEARAHGLVAQICGETDDQRIAAEQLYHHNFAGREDEVLKLAKQETFREQYRGLRSPDLIREDIGLALNVAAERVDVVVMIRLLLALVELDARASSLELLDMPGLLYEAGLANEAIAYCGDGATRVPLAQAYNLAARLGSANEPAGLRIFRYIEHQGPKDTSRIRVAGQEHDVAVAWTRAAAVFLPLSTVTAAVRNLAETPLATDQGDRNRQLEQWESYVHAMEALIDTVSRKEDEAALLAVDSALADDLTRLTDSMAQVQEDSDRLSRNQATHIIAAIKDLRVYCRTEMLSLAVTAETVEGYLDHLSVALVEPPVRSSTLLEIAEILAHYGRVDRAAAMLDRCPYNRALTVSEFDFYKESAALGPRFRYWRLRYALAPNADDVPDSVPPSIKTPAGDDVPLNSSLHKDFEAISLTVQVEDAIRKLGHLDAAVASGKPPSAADARSDLVRALQLLDIPKGLRGAHITAIRQQKPELMRIVVAVASRYGNGMPEQLKDELVRLFDAEPQYWWAGLKLALAEDLIAAGIDAPWYQDAVVAREAEADAGDVNSRLEVKAELVRCHARSGDLKASQRIATSMVSEAFGVGYRKDHQFDHWVTWLGLALAEPDGGRFVDDAAWLARLLAAVGPMTEGAPRSAAASLPATIVSANPVLAVRLFEYLVRKGAVQHFDALASLMGALVERTGTPDNATIQLTADITADLLAPAADKPFPSLASAVLSAAARTPGGAYVSDLAESMAARTDRYALPTARPGWREGLGLEVNDKKDAVDDVGQFLGHDIFALILADGRRIQQRDVHSHIQNVDDIISLRGDECEDSKFHWSRVIEQRELEPDDVPRLEEVFGKGTKMDPDVLILLAEAAERNGDQAAAFRLASDAFGSAGDHSWANYLGGTRLRAASLIIRLGDHGDLQAVCQDLARCASETPWLPSQLLPNLGDIVQALRTGTTASSVWSEIRTYLDGMAETLALTEDDPFADCGCQWWLSSSSEDRRMPGDSSTHAAALAELAVGHLSHASWIVRERASAVVVSGLVTGNLDIAEALTRFAQPGASDDMLERAGRCMAAARTQDGFVRWPCLEELDELLSEHPNQILRDLSTFQTSPVARPLSPKYQIILPSEGVPQVGSGKAFPGPYWVIYEALARELGVDFRAMLQVAAAYATDALALLPQRDSVREALNRSGVRHTFPSEELAASRAAAGRVLAEVVDAGLLDEAPTEVRHMLRTVDLELVGRAPLQRPKMIPSPPPAGIDKSVEWWLSGVEDRLSEYIDAAEVKDQLLVGASVRLTLLNSDYLEESYECGTTIGPTGTDNRSLFALRDSMRLQDLVTYAARGGVEIDGHLILENVADTFHQLDAGWLSFRPDLAAILEWHTDSTRPGCWHTSAGDLAVQTIWWVDGWCGHAAQSFDDTEAQGYVVILTSFGLRDVSAKFGDMTRHFNLQRFGRNQEAGRGAVSATRSLAIETQVCESS